MTSRFQGLVAVRLYEAVYDESKNLGSQPKGKLTQFVPLILHDIRARDV